MNSFARATVAELVPLARRVAALDPAALMRLRWHSERVTGLVWLPFDVLAARTIPVRADGSDDPIEADTRGAEGEDRGSAAGSRWSGAIDRTVLATDLIAWFERRAGVPASRDVAWRWPVPPSGLGWRRLDTVPEVELRPLVRQGALTLREAAMREAAPGRGAQPPQRVTDALLDTVVLEVADAEQRADVSLRVLSALLRLGFAPRDSAVAVDVAGSWLRVVGVHGTVYAQRLGLAMNLAPLPATRVRRG